jgi:hypothetical protein
MPYEVTVWFADHHHVFIGRFDNRAEIAGLVEEQFPDAVSFTAWPVH